MERYTFFYTRRPSDDDDPKGLRLDARLKGCHAFASARGVIIDEVVCEARTARKPGRPLFEAMLREVQSKCDRGIQVSILCDKPEWLLRNLADWARVNDLMAAGVEFLFVSRAYPNKAQAKTAPGSSVHLAKYYLDNLSAQLCKG